MLLSSSSNRAADEIEVWWGCAIFVEDCRRCRGGIGIEIQGGRLQSSAGVICILAYKSVFVRGSRASDVGYNVCGYAIDGSHGGLGSSTCGRCTATLSDYSIFQYSLSRHQYPSSYYNPRSIIECRTHVGTTTLLETLSILIN